MAGLFQRNLQKCTTMMEARRAEGRGRVPARSLESVVSSSRGSGAQPQRN